MSDNPQREEIARALHIPLYPLSDIRAWIEGIQGFLNLPTTMQNETRYRMAGKARTHFDFKATVTKLSLFNNYAFITGLTCPLLR